MKLSGRVMTLRLCQNMASFWTQLWTRTLRLSHPVIGMAWTKEKMHWSSCLTQKLEFVYLDECLYPQYNLHGVRSVCIAVHGKVYTQACRLLSVFSLGKDGIICISVSM